MGKTIYCDIVLAGNITPDVSKSIGAVYQYLKPCKECGSLGTVGYQVAEKPYFYNGCSNQNCDAFNNDNEFKSAPDAAEDWNGRNG